MAELNSRRAEVLETFAQEGVRHEQVYLVAGDDCPFLIYAIESADHERATSAYQQSRLAIDLEHRRLMNQVLGESVPVELLYECKAESAF